MTNRIATGGAAGTLASCATTALTQSFHADARFALSSASATYAPSRGR